MHTPSLTWFWTTSKQRFLRSLRMSWMIWCSGGRGPLTAGSGATAGTASFTSGLAPAAGELRASVPNCGCWKPCGNEGQRCLHTQGAAHASWMTLNDLKIGSNCVFQQIKISKQISPWTAVGVQVHQHLVLAAWWVRQQAWQLHFVAVAAV